MKNVYEVLRQKELELARLEKEVEALAATSTPQQPIRIPQAAVNASQPQARAAGWEDTAKRWP